MSIRHYTALAALLLAAVACKPVDSEPQPAPPAPAPTPPPVSGGA